MFISKEECAAIIVSTEPHALKDVDVDVLVNIINFSAMFGYSKAKQEPVAEPHKSTECVEQRSDSEHTGEPVAYVHADELEELSHCNGMSVWAENALAHTDDSFSKQLLPSGYVALYPGPQQRKPLTDEQMLKLLDHYAENPSDYRYNDPLICFARAIEAAHGIHPSDFKEKNTRNGVAYD